MKACAFTVITKNYLAYARTLMNSIKKVYPELLDLYVLLVDEVEGCFDINKENFNFRHIVQLGLPNIWSYLFRYSAFELLMAMKPWMFDYLFQKGYDSVFYFDSDVRVYRRLAEVENLLKESFMVLVPHITKSIDGDGKVPNDKHIMEAGVYNMGFFALRRHSELQNFLQWWKNKLEFNCVVEIENNLHVDQRFMDIAPSIFPDVAILRHDSYNVAFYNIMHRDTKDVAYFHYSGLKIDSDPKEFASFSIHQNRFAFEDLNEQVKKLIVEYKKELFENGLEECEKWDYSYNRFLSGEDITREFREVYRKDQKVRNATDPNPFINYNYFRNDLLFLKTNIDYFGFFDQEKPVSNAVWVSDYAIVKLPPSSGFLEITGSCERFNCEEFAIELLLNNEHLTTIPVSLGMFNVKIYLPESKEDRVLTIKPNKYFVPYLLGHNEDKRKLSFLVSSISINGQLLMDFSKKCPYIKRKKTEVGVNLVGYANAEHSLGQSLRNSAAAMEAGAINYNVIKIEEIESRRSKDFSLNHKIVKNNSHYINLFHINGNSPLSLLFQSDFFANHYNIGYWHWETADFPEEWFHSNKVLDEIWVPSQFMLKAVTEKAKTPVTLIPHPVEFKIQGYGRDYFNLPKDKFLFLIMYDMFSVQERKNPFAAIKAFRKAFPNQKDVALVIKTYGDDATLTEKLAELRASLRPQDILINKMLSRQEVYELQNACDCYISLHRAEGFGLNLAECMFLSKPVIATNWSGNLDFTTSKNSCLVDYTWMQLDKDYVVYPKGTVWAEADVDQASWHIKKIYDEPDFRTKLGKEGQKTIVEHFSPKAVGDLYRKRLNIINESIDY